MPALRSVVSRENFVNSEWNRGASVYCTYVCAQMRGVWLKSVLNQEPLRKWRFPPRRCSLTDSYRGGEATQFEKRRFVKLQAEGIDETWRRGIGMIRSLCEHISDPILVTQSLYVRLNFLDSCLSLIKLYSDRRWGAGSHSSSSFAVLSRIVLVTVYCIILRICTRSAKYIFRIPINKNSLVRIKSIGSDQIENEILDLRSFEKPIGLKGLVSSAIEWEVQAIFIITKLSAGFGKTMPKKQLDI